MFTISFLKILVQTLLENTIYTQSLYYYCYYYETNINQQKRFKKQKH